jgi:DNA primase
MDPDDVKEEIRRRIDIADLVSQYVPLQRAGRRLRARCPFHEEKTPSFYVDPERGHWKCFGCGESGDIFSFVMKMESLTFPEAGERLAQKVGLEWHTSPGAAQAGRERQTAAAANTAALEYYAQVLHSPQGQVARDYLDRREVSPEMIEAYQLGYAPEGWDHLLRHLAGRGFGEQLLAQAGLVKAGERKGHYDVFRHRLIFPIVDVAGRVVGFGGRALDPAEQAKYLNSPETPIFKKSQTVYGLNLARQAIVEADQALVVEGYMDVIALTQAGFRNAVACLGTATSETHLRLLSRYTENVCFVYDADAAGMKAALRNVTVFETTAADVKVATLPAGQDPDDCVRGGGPEVFRKCVVDAVSFIEYQIRMLFSQRDMDNADDRLRAAREAVAVLAKVPDRARQEEYLMRTAAWWAYGDPGRAEALARILRLELQRLRNEVPRRQGAVQRRADSKNVILHTVAKSAGPIALGVMLLEEQLLTVMLGSLRACQLAAARVTREDFADDRHRQIAEFLLTGCQADDFVPADAIYRLPEAGGVRERALELQLRSEPHKIAPAEAQEFDEKEFSASVEKLLYHRAARGVRPRIEFEPDPEVVAEDSDANETQEDFEALRRRVVEASNEGRLSHDDPDFIRFQRLSQRYRGKGRGGFTDNSGLTPLAPSPAAGKSVPPDPPISGSEAGAAESPDAP